MARHLAILGAAATLAVLAACNGADETTAPAPTPDPVDACLVVTEVDLERRVFADPGVEAPDFQAGRRSLPETTEAGGVQSGCVYTAGQIQVSATVRRELTPDNAAAAFGQLRAEAQSEGGAPGAVDAPFEDDDSFSVGFPDDAVALWLVRDEWVVGVRLEGIPNDRDIGNLAVETMRNAMLNLFGAEQPDPPEGTIPPPATPSPTATASPAAT